MIGEFSQYQALQAFLPAIEVSLDPVCLLTRELKMLFANQAMATLFELRPRDLSLGPSFCELIRLEGCDLEAKLKDVLATGAAWRQDEAPAVIRETARTVILKAVAFADPKMPQAGQAASLGLLVTLRDTSAENLMQAKYQQAKRKLGGRSEDAE